MIYDKSVFEKEHQLLKRSKEKCYAMHSVFSELKVNARCVACPIGKEEVYYSLEEKNNNCKSDRACKKVVAYKRKLLKAETEQSRIRDIYAKKIFDYFKEKTPDLILCNTGETVPWDDAFGNSFDTISTPQKNSLVALIEEDGGRYRLKEDEK